MTLAKRIRDTRYAKGWGPDELAMRASISRTALYQIECGKTGTPRAGTLRRIALALEVPVDALLEMDDEALAPSFDADLNGMAGQVPSAPESLANWFLEEREERGRISSPRRRDLTRKFQELLATPLGEGVARIVEETHRLLPNEADRSTA